MSRLYPMFRSAVLALLLCATPGLRAGEPAATEPLPVMKVWKTPNCGCCGKWVTYMQESGFTVEVTVLDDVAPIRARNGVPPRLGSCHTATVGGYVVEGHVPAEDVRRLLKERPQVLGLSAPAMPAGSPGMDVPNSPPYTVVSFTRDGESKAYATHGN